MNAKVFNLTEDLTNQGPFINRIVDSRPDSIVNTPGSLALCQPQSAVRLDHLTIGLQTGAHLTADKTSAWPAISQYGQRSH